MVPKNRIPYFLFAAVLVLGAAVVAKTPHVGPVNLDFESPYLQDSSGQGWFIPNKRFLSDYAVEIKHGDAAHGDQYVEVTSLRHPTKEREFGNVMQTFDARPFRGKTVLFRAAVRNAQPSTGRAQLWLRVDRHNEHMGFFDNMGDRPIRATSWKEYDIVGTVDSDAEYINIGCMLIGTGKVDFDNAQFREIELSAEARPEPARPLDDQELQSLHAFAKLYGYVRFFYPSDAVANADWNAAAVSGVRTVARARNSSELAEALNSFFHPVAPLVQVFPTGQTPPPPVMPSDQPAVAWLHYGVKVSDEPGLYNSYRVTSDGHVYNSSIPTGTYGGVSQSLPALSLRGKRVTFSVALRSKNQNSYQHTTLSLWSYGKDGLSRVPFASEAVRPTDSWTSYHVAGTVPMIADSIIATCRTTDDFTFYADDAELSAPGSQNLLVNPGFEAGLDGWQGSPTQYFVENVDERNLRSGSAGLSVQSRKAIDNLPDDFPNPSEPLGLVLGSGLSCVLPVALYSSAAHVEAPDFGKLPLGFTPSGNDRSTRLADIIIIWNVMQHFFPYFDVTKPDWNAALDAGLQQAATDKTESDFTRTLQMLVAKLRDGHGYVSASRSFTMAPFQATYTEGQYVVNQTLPEAAPLSRGDIIISVNGEPIANWARSQDSITPASTPQAKHYLIGRNLFGLVQADSLNVGYTDASGSHHTTLVPVLHEYQQIRGRSGSPIRELKPGIMYLDLDRATESEFDSAMTDLATAKAIIVDMRGYPQHMMTPPIAHMIDTTITSARWNVPVTMYPDHIHVTWDFSNWPVIPAKPRFTRNIVHITDGRAVSAAETYMGIIESYHIGEIVGGPTAGTNGNINPFVLPGQYHVSWTGMKVLKHDGAQHHAIGIQPTVPTEPTIAGIRSGTDEVLEAAIKVAESHMH